MLSLLEMAYASTAQDGVIHRGLRWRMPPRLRMVYSFMDGSEMVYAIMAEDGVCHHG